MEKLITEKAEELQGILLENEGKDYSIEQIEKALKFWLSEATESLIEDADHWIFKSGFEAKKFNPAKF